MYELDGPKFFRLAYRITAYQGVMAARQAREGGDAGTGPTPAHEETQTVDDLQELNRLQVAGGAGPLFEIGTG